MPVDNKMPTHKSIARHSASNTRKEPLDTKQARDESQSRKSRTRLRTHRKLVEAAERVMAEKGVERTTIADITEAADVGFGSFYNYFSSKEDMVSTIAKTRAEEFVDTAKLIVATESDATVALAYNVRAFLSKAVSDPIWGWFFVRTHGVIPNIDKLFLANIQSDLVKAVQQHNLALSVNTAATITLGALLGIMRGILDERLPFESIEETAEYLLRLYGVSPGKARRLARVPLPRYVRDRHSSGR